jgi:hypothetical protein
MKMTKRELKNVVKECLIEILSEGLVSTQKTLSESTVQAAPRATQERAPVSAQRSNIADKISFLPNREEIRRPVNRPSVEPQNLARSLTSDPVLADIFADTARSGAHQKMNESIRNGMHESAVAAAGDTAAKVMLQSDPTDIFGDSASKWATLAFSEKIPVRS